MSQSKFFNLTTYRKTKRKQKTKRKESFVELKKYLKIEEYVNIYNKKLFVRNYFSKNLKIKLNVKGTLLQI